MLFIPLTETGLYVIHSHHTDLFFNECDIRFSFYLRSAKSATDLSTKQKT